MPKVSRRGPNIQRTAAGCRYPYVLNISAKASHTGKRVRNFFDTLPEAEKALAGYFKKAEAHGKQAGTLPNHVFSDAATARKLLDAAGSSSSLTDAVRAYLKISKARNDSKTIETALEKWQNAPTRAGRTRRPDTQAEIDTLAKQLNGAFGAIIVAEITAERVASFLEDLGRVRADGSTSPAAFNKRIKHTAAFFSFCAGHGWCDGSIVTRLKARRKRVEEKSNDQPGILTPQEFTTLLEKAEEVDPSLVDYIAVCGLAGIRPEEAARLTFAEFKPKEGADGVILIPDGSAKTRKARDVAIRPALRLWLSRKGGFYERAKRSASEPLVRFQGQALDKRLARVRYLAGWRVKVRGKKYPYNQAAKPYPHDSLRHTFASAYIAEGSGRLEDLIFSFGHAGNTATLRRHYVHRYTKPQAAEWFAVIPSGGELPPALRVVEGGKVSKRTERVNTKKQKTG